MRGTLLWFGIYCLWAVVFFTIIWPWAKGRIPNDKRRAYRQSDDWAALAAAVTARRGYRCAARYRCAGPLHLHHWDVRSYGWERPWQVLWLCERHHLAYRVVDDPVTREPYRKPYRFSVHWWSEWIFSDLERGLWLTTPMVVGAGKLRALGRRTHPQRTPSPTMKIPGSFAHGDVMLGPDGRIVQRTGKDWQDIS